ESQVRPRRLAGRSAAGTLVGCPGDRPGPAPALASRRGPGPAAGFRQGGRAGGRPAGEVPRADGSAQHYPVRLRRRRAGPRISTRRVIVVADAGPIIHLSLVNKANLFALLYRWVLVPT